MTEGMFQKTEHEDEIKFAELIIKHLKTRNSFLIIIILLAGAIVYFVEPRFLSQRNLTSMFMGMTYELLLAMGMTLVLILGGIDLSVGSVLGLAGVTITMLISKHQPYQFSLVLAILIGLLVAGVCGLINGLNVTKLKLAPFISTLGMMAIARGLATVWTSGWYISGLPDSYVFIGQGTFLGIPYPIYFVLVVMIVFSILLSKWKPLNQAYFVGHNPEAARMSGLRVQLITLVGYSISGVFAGLAALFMTTRLAMGFFQFGVGGELNAIAAAVIGGASFSGGRGNLFGTFLGMLLVAVINNGFVFLSGDPNYKMFVQGLIVFIAIGVDAYRRRNELRARSN